MNQTMLRHALMALTMLACVGLTATPALAQYPERAPADEPSAAAMALDFLVARPLGVISTVAGVGIFVLSLPFSLLGGNVEGAAEMLVAEPATYTFSRPLGVFEPDTFGQPVEEYE